MNDNVTLLWNKCLDIIRDNVQAEQFAAWFEPIVPVSFVDNKLTLRVPSQFFVEIIEEKYCTLLLHTFNRVFGRRINLAYAVVMAKDVEMTMDQSGESAKIKTGAKIVPQAVANPFRQEPLDDIDPQLNPRYTFENYCCGNSNKLAVTVAMAIADHPEVKTYNPMFIFGATGVGKTHLIQAIGIRIKEQNPRARVLYVPARVFESQYTSAVPKGKVNDFINFYQSIDVLLIDDIHELAGKTGTQNTFFHIFNHLHQHGKQLVMTSDRRPVDMDGMVPRLISRFKWGMTVQLDKPDYELRREVLIRRAAQDGLTITDDVVDFIATQVTDSVRDLEGVVVSLLAHATMLNQDITIELAQSVASNTVHVSRHEITFDNIAETVADFYNIDTDLIFGKTRKREISDARQVVMYFAKTKTQLSSTNIGLRMARNHATVLHACKQVEQRMGIERKFRDEILAIEARLKTV
ncbi:MAG: chromosomal replication initiator protein DnaA [Muribaculaceae bacterium]|nr:chromosomal replication initiator protein DnaA [Muribaculaceae bacterium]